MDFLLILLTVLGIIFITTLIILCVRLNFTLSKVDTMLDDILKKLDTVNNVFEMIDKVTDSINLINDKMVEKIVSLITKIFAKRKKKEEIEEEF